MRMLDHHNHGKGENNIGFPWKHRLDTYEDMEVKGNIPEVDVKAARHQQMSFWRHPGTT